MRDIRHFKSSEEDFARKHATDIFKIIAGREIGTHINSKEQLIRAERYKDWHVDISTFNAIISTDDKYGVEFRVHGVRHNGYIRIFNIGGDVYDIELRKVRGKSFKDEITAIGREYLHDALYTCIMSSISKVSKN